MKIWRIAALVMALLAITTLGLACGGDDEPDSDGTGDASPTEAASPTGGADGEVVELEIAAENTAYDVAELTAPAGAEVTLVFDNDDPDIQHNFSLYESEESEDPLFEGDIITGVDSIDYVFPAPEDPGTYHFHCDVHPADMQGEFIVE
jgi:plastocyanin